MMYPRALLDRPAVRGLQPEQIAHVGIADQLRAWIISGRLRAVVCHVPNELPIVGNPRMAASIGAKRKAMLGVPGAGDFVVTWASGSGWIEVKRPGGEARLALVGDRWATRKAARGRLSDTQEEFRDWCAAMGVHWTLATAAAELESVLVGWGCLAAVGGRDERA